ncbi:MAG: carbohydrate kinase family protein [Actinomycetota bacterium]
MTDLVDLIVVGDVMVDVLVDAETLASGGHVPGAVRIRPGGAAANAAVWAASEGARVRLYGRIGSDLAGSLVRESLEARGVETELAIDDEAPTGTILIAGNRAVRSPVADPGANTSLAPSDLPVRLVARALLVSGYSLLDPSSEPAARAALERAETGILVVDAASASLIDAYGAEQFLEATERATVLLADEREAEALTRATGEEAVQKLASRFHTVVVKHGAGGAILARGDRLLRVEPLNVTETEATGSGDAFAGVLLAHLAHGNSEEKALDAACRAGEAVATSLEPWPER